MRRNKSGDFNERVSRYLSRSSCRFKCQISHSSFSLQLEGLCKRQAPIPVSAQWVSTGTQFQKQEVLEAAGTGDNDRHPREPGTAAAPRVPPPIHSPCPSPTFLPSTVKNTRCPCREKDSQCVSSQLFPPDCFSPNFSALEGFQEKTLAELQGQRKPRASCSRLRNFHSELLALGSILSKYQITLQR